MLPEIPNEFDRLIKAQRGELSKEELALLKRIIAAYGLFVADIEIYIRALIRMIQDNPNIDIVNTREYELFVREVDKGINSFSEFAKTELKLAALAVGALAIKHITQTKMEKLDALPFLDDFLRVDGLMFQKFTGIAGHVVKRVTKELIEGVKLGRSPQIIFRDVVEAIGAGLNDAMNIVRTAQMWAYRESKRAGWMANGIQYWIWFATLDDVTCMSCIVMDGTIHEITEPLNDHHRGRCDMLRYPDDLEFYKSRGSGYEWYHNQSEEVQAAMMGKEKHAAYKDGLFTFDKLTTTYEDAVYGVMRSETALKDLING